MNTATEYARGLHDHETAEKFHRYDVMRAAQSWRDAANDHGHTSFYGAQTIRAWRAYWLGVLKSQREQNLGF